MYIDIIQFILFVVLLIFFGYFLGKYIKLIFSEKNTWVDKIYLPIEKLIYKFGNINTKKNMNWKNYVTNLIIFNSFGMLFLYILQTLQSYLPLNLRHLPNVTSVHLALNTAISYMTNTDWQAYNGETALSYFVQIAGLTVQNFLSAATGLSVAIVFIRSFIKKETEYLGNFWVDLTRGIIRLLLPLSILFAFIFVQQGVIQNLSPYVTITTLENKIQQIAMGPVASQEAIKLLGTNGGGFFNANSAHPFENPTPLTNFLEAFAIFLIPAGLVFGFGFMIKDKEQGITIFITMLMLFLLMLTLNYASEYYGNPLMTKFGVSSPNNFEGKEIRFGLGGSSLFTTVTTASSCGAVNTMHDSLTPIGGFVALLQIMVGEVIFGGIGSGLYGMFMYILITVFIVGLMVGRSPEFLGKKIESKEIKMAILAILIPSITLLSFSAIAVMMPFNLLSLKNSGPHGLSEILYAFASGTGNNGSAFAGLNVNTLFFNMTIGVSMLIGRFIIIISAMVIAGELIKKKKTPTGPGTFLTNGMLFAVLLAGSVIVVGALTFLPALTLGPIIEHLQMLQATS